MSMSFVKQRSFSNLMLKGREMFSPKISEKLTKSFDASFPAIKETTSLSLPDLKLPNLNSPNYNNFVQPGRTYREELYASRRFELNPSQNPNYAFKKLQSFLQDEKIPAKVKEKRHFIRPGLVKHAIIYAGRRKKFDGTVRDTINKIVQINESLK